MEKKAEHYDISVLIAHYLEGSLSGKEEKFLKEWRQSSPGHERLFNQITESKDFTTRYRQWSQTDANKSWKKVERRCLGQVVSSKRKHIATKRVLLLAVAVALLFFILTIFTKSPDLYRQPLQPVEISQNISTAIHQMETSGQSGAVLHLSGSSVYVKSDSALAVAISSGNNASGTIKTLHEKEFWLTLSDGSRVHLNSSSSLTYPVEFTSETRDVELSGEAYFIVAHDAEHPFRVHTRKGVVTVLGTEFNVNTRGVHDATQVVLVKGSVRTTLSSGEEALLHPGEMADLGEDIKVRKVDTTPYVAWNTGKFQFSKCRLEQLMNVLAKWYGMEVKFRDPQLREKTFTGQLSKYESPVNTLAAISLAAGIEVTEQHGIIVVDRKN
jgi:transmembrane sensor